MEDFRTVTVLGAGVLGSQIAFHTAYAGCPVTSYDIDEPALEVARERFAALARTYCDEVAGADDATTSAALGRLVLTSDLESAVADADLVVEAVPEILSLKRDVYRRIGAAAPQRTIFATNSSTLLPSALADATGRPDRFLALHFANRVWRFNTAEVMGTAATDPAVYARVVEFATAIGMVPIELHKEKAGYVTNTLLVPFLAAAIELAAGRYAEPVDIDRTWRIATGAPVGPFQMLDVIGLGTPYNIMVHSNDPGARTLAAWLHADYISKGKLGVESGEGFYRYRRQ